MAAYAALVSVMHIVEQIERHPFPPISLDKKQCESLTEDITFLQEFLEGYPSIGSNEGDGLESRILDAAHAAEDVIESHIVDCIHAGGSKGHGDQVEFGQLLQKVIEDMDLIKKEVVEAEGKMGVALQRNSMSSYSGDKHNITMPKNSTSSSSVEKKNATMEGFDDALLELLDKLTRGLNRQIIPIVGMGGMGKTTLARNVYAHQLIKEHFDIHAWTTISQEYDAQNILNDILSQAKQDKENSSEKNEKKIGDYLYKYLFGRKYLIVMDDMWNIQAWEKIKFFFPDNNNGSRIVVTTRLSSLARRLSNSSGLDMRFLDLKESWALFSKIVFPRDGYSPEIVGIGKKIVKNCRGLPLSIVVVGGLLAKSDYNRDNWEYIERNLNSVVNCDNDEHCLKVLQLSYNQLPLHLKPCFLHMGMFKEDSKTPVSKLVKLWVAEGFLKSINGKDLEVVAKEYLNDLVDRNLLLIVESGKKCVKIHDLLRDLSQRQAQAERFYNVVIQNSTTIPKNHHRLIFPNATLEKEVHDAALLSMPLARSIICYNWPISLNCRLLRIFGASDERLFIDDDDYYYSRQNNLQLSNLKYLAANYFCPSSKFATSLPLFWNLQTLVIKETCEHGFSAPTGIWNMPQLRHIVIYCYVYVPDPPVSDGQDVIVLKNLLTLMQVRNFKCGEEVVKRIPNIKKLSLVYEDDDEIEESCLDNLDRFHKLKSFCCTSYPHPKPDGTGFLQKLSFPRSLQKLGLETSHVHWEDMLEQIGSLPLLQKLELRRGYFITHV